LALVSAIFSRALTTLKNSEKIHKSNFICFLYPSKEAHPKTKHKKKYGEEKLGDFIFAKTSFSKKFPLNLRLITPYSLVVLI